MKRRQQQELAAREMSAKEVAAKGAEVAKVRGRKPQLQQPGTLLLDWLVLVQEKAKDPLSIQ